MGKSVTHLFPAILSRLRAPSAGARDEAGSAIVELALILGLFGSPLLLGTVEIASLLYSSIEVSNAAHAGVMYGMMSSTYASDASGITNAAREEASDFGVSLTATPSIYYVCSAALAGTQYATQTAANTACTGTGNHSIQFIQVTASAAVTPPVRMPALPATITLSSTSAMEVEQ
jgi:Flp pilus assembly protein TadG